MKIEFASRGWRHSIRKRNREMSRKRATVRSRRGAGEYEGKDEQGRSKEKRRPETKGEGAKMAKRPSRQKRRRKGARGRSAR